MSKQQKKKTMRKTIDELDDDKEALKEYAKELKKKWINGQNNARKQIEIEKNKKRREWLEDKWVDEPEGLIEEVDTIIKKANDGRSTAKSIKTALYELAKSYNDWVRERGSDHFEEEETSEIVENLKKIYKPLEIGEASESSIDRQYNQPTLSVGDTIETYEKQYKPTVSVGDTIETFEKQPSDRKPLTITDTQYTVEQKQSPQRTQQLIDQRAASEALDRIEYLRKQIAEDKKLLDKARSQHNTAKVFNPYTGVSTKEEMGTKKIEGLIQKMEGEILRLSSAGADLAYRAGDQPLHKQLKAIDNEYDEMNKFEDSFEEEDTAPNAKSRIPLTRSMAQATFDIPGVSESATRLEPIQMDETTVDLPYKTPPLSYVSGSSTTIDPIEQTEEQKQPLKVGGGVMYNNPLNPMMSMNWSETLNKWAGKNEATSSTDSYIDSTDSGQETKQEPKQEEEEEEGQPTSPPLSEEEQKEESTTSIPEFGWSSLESDIDNMNNDDPDKFSMNRPSSWNEDDQQTQQDQQTQTDQTDPNTVVAVASKTIDDYTPESIVKFIDNIMEVINPNVMSQELFDRITPFLADKLLLLTDSEGHQLFDNIAKAQEFLNTLYNKRKKSPLPKPLIKQIRKNETLEISGQLLRSMPKQPNTHLIYQY